MWRNLPRCWHRGVLKLYIWHTLCCRRAEAGRGSLLPSSLPVMARYLRYFTTVGDPQPTQLEEEELHVASEELSPATGQLSAPLTFRDSLKRLYSSELFQVCFQVPLLTVGCISLIRSQDSETSVSFFALKTLKTGCGKYSYSGKEDHCEWLRWINLYTFQYFCFLLHTDHIECWAVVKYDY